jgi:predicted Zn-dependent protease
MRAALTLGIALSLGGCVSYAGYPVTRTLGGETRHGVFVAPAQYEDFVRAELAAARGDLTEAIAYYERARAGGEDDVLLVARLADALDRSGERARAVRALEHGRSLDGHAAILFSTEGAIAERHGETDAAIDAYARAHDADPRNEEPVLALARLLEASGNAERAQALLADYARTSPGALGTARAALALALSRHDAAAVADAASSLLRIAPGHDDEIEAAARALNAQGDAVIAHRLLSRLPEEVVDRALAIDVAIAAGDRGDAERRLAFPPDERPASLVGDARFWLALGDAERATELAQVALAGAPDSSEATLVLADARLARGDAPGAAALYASIPVGATTHDAAREGLAHALEAAGLPALGAEVRDAER